jgi:creatinine amidohydrolase
VIWHEVWDGRPDELAAEIDPEYDHASWSENFPWTRIDGVDSPEGRKPRFTRPPVNTDAAWREALGDGSFGGPYQLRDEDVLRVWKAAVAELRERLDSGWP